MNSYFIIFMIISTFQLRKKLNQVREYNLRIIRVTLGIKCKSNKVGVMIKEIT